jgi:hypothetical protein
MRKLGDRIHTLDGVIEDPVELVISTPWTYRSVLE